MELTLHKPGEPAGKVEVSEAVFGVAYNGPLVHQILTSYTAASRAGTRAQKNRAAVRGGGKKPFRQKGMGRARAGTIRSPLWRGGGVNFAARPQDYTKKVNRKMYRGAMRSILSELVRQERLVCIEEFSVAEPKTKKAIGKLAEIQPGGALIIMHEISRDTYLATRNIPHVDLVEVAKIDPYSLIGFDKVLITRDALKKIESWLS